MTTDRATSLRQRWLVAAALLVALSPLSVCAPHAQADDFQIPVTVTVDAGKIAKGLSPSQSVDKPKIEGKTGDVVEITITVVDAKKDKVRNQLVLFSSRFKTSTGGIRNNFGQFDNPFSKTNEDGQAIVKLTVPATGIRGTVVVTIDLPAASFLPPQPAKLHSAGRQGREKHPG